MTGQIQIRKYSSEDNTVTGQLAGTPLEGAVFEITQARSGKVVGYIVTDARGVAASGPLLLPLLRDGGVRTEVLSAEWREDGS